MSALEEKLQTAEALVSHLQATILQESVSDIFASQGYPEASKTAETKALSHASHAATLIRQLVGQA